MMNENKLPQIPIVGLTAYLDERENCLKMGMDDFSKLYIK